MAQVQGWLAGLWAGVVLALGGLAAPALFSVLERSMAGTGAGRIFTLESYVSLGISMLMFVLERRRVRDAVDAGQAQSAMSATLLMVLAILFLTIVGQHVLHPMIQAARQGQSTALSFGALHGISAVLYWCKAVLLLVMAWRVSGAKPAA
jgi:hypothetical protein